MDIAPLFLGRNRFSLGEINLRDKAHHIWTSGTGAD
jgi:hypothetical protein